MSPRYPFTALLAAALATGCSHRVSPAAGPGPTLHLVATDTIQRGWMASDSAAIALGLPPLRQAAPGTGVREIRVWTGIEIGEPHDLLRLVRRGDHVDGIFAYHWEVEGPPQVPPPDQLPMDSVLRYSFAGECGAVHRVGHSEACPIQLKRQPDWRRLWDSLERLGVWQLADQSIQPNDSVVVFDGWSMTVELRDGPFYRSFAYSNPNAHKGAAFRAATAIGQIENGLWVLMMPKTNNHIVRGRLAIGTRSTEFLPCGSTETWGATGVNSPATDSLYRIIPQNDSVSRQVRYAVLRGMDALPQVVRGWGSPYTHVLEVDTVLSISSWTGKECARR
jgi:hypothetical protein